jgi:predicted O-methyltransferase YrrM
MKDEQVKELHKTGMHTREIAQKLVITEPDVWTALGMGNPVVVPHWKRFQNETCQRRILTERIQQCHENRFVTPAHTCEFIESLITMSEAKHMLELGTYTGFCAMHMLRAIAGIPDATVTSIDARPAHDREWFSQFPQFRFLEGATPGVLDQLRGQVFDVVFTDSDHSPEHTAKEIDALMLLTKNQSIFLFHDCPFDTETYRWLRCYCAGKEMEGAVLPTAPEPSPREPRSNLGVFVRMQ